MLNRCTGGGGERGSVLVLVPAAFLVLVLLGGLAVDSAVSYQAQQQLHDRLAAAAADAVSAGLDQGAFYRGGAVVFDAATVEGQVCRSLAAQGGGDLGEVRVAAAMSGPTLDLQGSARVRMVFGGAIPGLRYRSVRSSAQATLEEAGTAVAPPGVAATVPLLCGSLP